MKPYFTFFLFLILSIGFVENGFSQAGNYQSSLQISAVSTTSVQDKSAGEAVCFTLTARDKNGFVIRTWDQIGSPSTLILRNSTANTDTNRRSWNGDPEAYSFASLSHGGVNLLQLTDSTWTLDQTAFVDGQAQVCLTDTKAESGVHIEVLMSSGSARAYSDTLRFHEGDIANYLINIAWSTNTGYQVFVQRPYEVIVTARDKYLNPCTTDVCTRFSARWPGDFSSVQTGGSDPFAEEVFLSGPTSYIIVSNSAHSAQAPQSITAYSVDNPNLRGVSSSFEVLDHAPVAFKLLLPWDNYILTTNKFSNPFAFHWERPFPADPYTNIHLSFNDTVFHSDVIKYTWIIEDALTRSHSVRIPADSGGTSAQISLNEGRLYAIMQTVSGHSNTSHYDFIWSVEASDGLFLTHSDPPDGYAFTLYSAVFEIESSSLVTGVQLQQNYPNPFNPATTISFTTTAHGFVKLVIHDLFGSEVATLVSSSLDPGAHQINFDASGLPSGQYMYTLSTEGKRMSRMMTVLK